MSKSPGIDGFASRPTLGRWLTAFLGLVMLFSAATQVAAAPVAYADAGPVLSRAADLPGEPCESGEPRCPADECIASACHGFWLSVPSGAGVLSPTGAVVTPECDQSVAGNAVLPPLHPPKISLRV